MTLTVPCASQVTASYTAPLTHRCPFRDEIDEGAVTVTWTTTGSTLELHALAAWLDGFKDDRVSHEDLTDAIGDHLDALPGITGVEVVTEWATAGARVVIRRAVPGQRVLVGRA